MKKKELDYFTIDGGVGGNQDWFQNVVMYMGGCAAATACDCCIDLARRKGMTHLYPFDPQNLTREEYVRFAMRMKPYLKPRVGGVSKLWMFTEGFSRYLQDAGEKKLRLQEFSGERSAREAETFIRQQIDSGFPVPYLMLKHKKTCYKDFTWHWFLCYGYEETKEGAGRSVGDRIRGKRRIDRYFPFVIGRKNGGPSGNKESGVFSWKIRLNIK